MAGGGDNGVTTAEVNLKFIWDVVSQIKIGSTGRAYVVDGRGQLVAHPDISLVLQNTNLSRLTQVEAALLAPPGSARREITVAQDSAGRQVLTASAPIAPLGWWVFVEQPLGEALAPLYASAYRTVALLLAGVAFSVLASLLLARRIATPIQALEAGAARIGAGALDQRIDVKTGDELEGLADQFNRMAGQLQESYANLEQKVEDRTRELTRGARAPDGDGRGPPGHLELPDGHPAGARHRRRAGHAALRGGRRGRPADRGRVHADRRAPWLHLRPDGRGHAAGRSARAAGDAPHGPEPDSRSTGTGRLDAR